MSKFEASVRTQDDLQHRISRIVSNLRKLGKEKITPLAISTRLETLEAHWNSFQTGHASLIAAQTSENEAHAYFKDDYYELCEDAYFAAKDELLTMRESLIGSTNETQLNGSLNVSASLGTRGAVVRAFPKISLPKFSGDYSSWPTFRDLFRSMIIANNDISPVEKIHYLKSHVTGEAARRISNFAVTADNFARAWDVLVARYENKRVLVNAYLEQLFETKPLTKKSAYDLKELIATVNEALGGLKMLDVPIESWDCFLVYLVSKRLDSDTREAWELLQGNTTEPATFAKLEMFLDGRTRALEMVAPSNSEKQARTTKPVKSKLAAHVNSASANTLKCSLCNEEHYLARCPVFSDQSVNERRETVNSKRLCYNCLGPHKISECRTTKRCRLCNGRHHTLIHLPRDSTSNAINAASPAPATTILQSGATATSASQIFTAHSSNNSDRSLTLLATALVHIVNDHGHSTLARVPLDQGSELSFVREAVAQGLPVSRQKASIPIIGVGSRSVGSTRGALPLRLRSCVEPAFDFNILAYVLPHLTGRLPAAPVSLNSWTHIHGLPLADPTFAMPGKIDLILGADILGTLIRPAIRQGLSNQPTAQQTALGWILFGPVDSTALKSTSRTFVGAPDQELSELLQKFWMQEEVPSRKSL